MAEPRPLKLIFEAQEAVLHGLASEVRGRTEAIETRGFGLLVRLPRHASEVRGRTEAIETFTRSLWNLIRASPQRCVAEPRPLKQNR